MINQYHIRKGQIERLCVVCMLLISPIIMVAQSLQVVATGTGRTTGHIANLSITNTTQSTIIIYPQTCYIPAADNYQPYVATIPGTSIPPGINLLRIDGYCANVQAQPVPAGSPMSPASAWIPVVQQGTIVPPGSIPLLTTPAAPEYTPADIPVLVNQPGYTPLRGKTSTVTTTWPNTTIPFEGTIDPAGYPRPYAPLLVEALNQITNAFDNLKMAGEINTPFSASPKKERDAVIQQTFWIYTARITGTLYQKEQFREKILKQFEEKNNTEISVQSRTEVEKLEKGIDVFWNTFMNLTIEANLRNGTKSEMNSADAAMMITSLWNKIDLMDHRMKPDNQYGIAGGNKFPILPAIGGAVGLGTLIVFATIGDEDDPIDTVDCSFTVTAIPTGSTCGLSNGRIVLNVNPPATYTFQWSNGSAMQSLTNIPAGNYSVTVSRPGTMCSQILTSTVTNSNQNFTATISTQDSDCNQPTGAASVTTSPPGAYTYLWSNGATTSGQSNLSAGNYTVTVSAGGTCQQILSAQIGTAVFEPSVSFTTTPSTCGGADGSATVSVSPSDQYAFAWSNGQSGTTITGLAAGTYNVTITKPGTTCSYMASVTVDDTGASFAISVSSTMSGCGLSDGTASAVVDPPGSYEFLWSNGQTGSQIAGLAPGNYTVTVSIPGTSCTKEANVTITELSASFVVSLSGTQAGCGLSDGTATASVNPPGNYSYAWSNGQTGSQIVGLAPGNYTVTVSVPGTDCSMQGNITIDAGSFPYEISLSTTPASCGGTDGTITATATPPDVLTYQWSNGQTGSQLSGVGAGTYTVTVTVPGTSCSKTSTATIEALPPSFTASISTTPAGCGLNNGTATATVNPPGSYDFVWSNGATGSQLSDISAGEYTVTVSIAGTSCSQIATATVAQLPPSYSLSFTSSPAGCGLANGSAAVMVDPPGTYTYQWSNGSTMAQLANVGAGIYTVTVTITGTSCAATDSVEIDQTGGGFTATFTTDNASCGLSNGSATITVNPPGAYTYVWSNQQTGATVQQVGAGTYSVTVSDSNDCEESFSVTIEEDAAEYIAILNTVPAFCTGGGNIIFTVITPGPGPMDIEVEGPEGNTMITAVSGSVLNLSAFINVLPGTYTLTVTDQHIGPMCTETVSATIADITPPIDPDSDFFTAQGSIPLQENALNNDTGYNIEMTQVDNENGGTVIFTPNGDFTFMADIGFSGEAYFVYTVTDDCGNTGTAEVTIIVEALPCDINVSFESTPASCGLEDGSLTVIVSEPGDYEYEWSNGDSGPELVNIPPDAYFVTITDLEIGCTFEASFLLAAMAGDYIGDVELTQPTCDSDGEIEFVAFSPGGNTLSLQVIHPFGNDVFDIEEGVILLSDYILTVPGQYIIEVSDPEAGLGCSESIVVTLDAPPLPEILVVEVFPPSFPGAMDGSAFIEVIQPGQFSYAVYHNGAFAFIINQNNFFLINLSAGVHSVYLVDINGCQSNTEEFVVPVMSAPNFSFGISLTDAGSYSASNEQPTITRPGRIWRSALSGSYRFDVGKIRQEVRAVYAPSVRISGGQLVDEYFALEYFSGPEDLIWKQVSLRAQAGLGMHLGLYDQGLQSGPVPVYWLLRASAERRIWKRILLAGAVSWRGTDVAGPLNGEFGVRWLMGK